MAGLLLLVIGPAAAAGQEKGDGSERAQRAYLALAQEKAVLERENRLLGVELALAGQDSSYVIIDLRARKLRIKLQGVEMAAYDLLDLSLKGDTKSWPDSSRYVAGPFTVTRKEDLGPPPVPPKPKPRSPLDFLPPEPEDPTPCYYDLCFGDALVLHVVPGDSTLVDPSPWMKRVSKQVVKAFQGVRHTLSVAMGWEARDPRVRVSFRLPFDQSRVIFRASRVGLQGILVL